MTIDQLPNEVLLDIFKFYVDMPCPDLDTCSGMDSWQVLVHVCQRWRSLVFASPRRLDLELLCTNRRPVTKKLDIWPDLPIVVYTDFTISQRYDVSNIAFALKQHNRISGIEIVDIPNSLLEEFVAIKMPFPVLTDLALWVNHKDLDVIIPDSFLGGSAPRLRVLHLDRIPFPALPKLLSSTTELVALTLYWVPDSGFISPNAMATGLSALKRLETLRLEFGASRSRAHRENRHPPAVTRTILPALTEFRLESDGEYVEAFMSQIDTPILEEACITFSGQPPPPESDSPQLRDFISRTEAFKAPHWAKVIIGERSVFLTFF